MSRKVCGSTEPKMEEAVVLESDKNEGVMFKNGKLKIPTPAPAIDISTSVPQDQKMKVGGINLDGEKPSKITKKKVSLRKDTSVGIDLHEKFSEVILKALPKTKEKQEKSFSMIILGEKIICFIRDKHGLSVASRFYEGMKAQKIKDEKGISPVVEGIVAGYEKQKKGVK